jgi:hypothetical protein
MSVSKVETHSLCQLAKGTAIISCSHTGLLRYCFTITCDLTGCCGYGIFYLFSLCASLHLRRTGHFCSKEIGRIYGLQQQFSSDRCLAATHSLVLLNHRISQVTTIIFASIVSSCIVMYYDKSANARNVVQRGQGEENSVSDRR